jgi:hypothetical protein
LHRFVPFLLAVFALGAAERRPAVSPYSLAGGTRIGGSASDFIGGMAVDGAGNVYVAGWTESLSLPYGSVRTRQTGVEAFVLKMTPGMNSVVWATFLGGSMDDRALAIAVDSGGSVRVAGFTTSTDFPTLSAAQAVTGGGSRDAFVARFDANGALIFSTYLGGASAETANAIALSSSGSVWIAGVTDSVNFPRQSAYQNSYGGGLTDAFVTQLNSAGALVSSTYLGASGADTATAIGLDSSGNVYVAGGTSSTSFPALFGAQPVHGGGQDGFVTKFSPGAASIAYSTFIGGADRETAGLPELVQDLAILPDGSVLIAGTTCAMNFPLVLPLQGTFGGGTTDAFLARLSPNGNSLLFSSYWGGASTDEGRRVVVRADGNVYFAGTTASINLPEIEPVQIGQHGNYDTFLLKLTPELDIELLSSWFGEAGSESLAGLATSGTDLLISGHTDSNNLFGSPPNGLIDAFVARIAEVDYAVSISSTAAGVSFTITGAGCSQSTYQGSTILLWKPGARCTVSFLSTQLSGETRYVFKNWHDGSTANPRTFTAAPGIGTLNLNFSTEHRVTVVTAPPGNGTVQMSPNYADFYYPASSVVALTPSAPPGYAFTNWSGSAAGTASPLLLTVNGPATVAANFACAYQLSQLDFPLSDAAQAVSITVSTAAGCSWSASTPLPWAALSAAGFTGPATVNVQVSANGSGTSRSGSITIAGRTVTLSQGVVTNVPVTVGSAPAGLPVSVSGDGCPSGTYLASTVLAWRRGLACQLSTVSPQAQNATTRYVFERWSDNVTAASRSLAPTAALTMTATFRTEHRLTATVTPESSGSVVITPASADGYYAANTSISVSAVAAPTHTFSGWSGDLSGANLSASIVLSGPRAIGAAFAARAACTIALSGQSISVGTAGTAASLSITTTPAGCSWTAASSASWVQVYPLAGSGNGTLQYTVYPNFRSSSRSASITVNSSAKLVSQTAAAGTYNERLAGLMYFNFFGRLPAANELALQAGVLNAGTHPADLVNSFFQTAEFNLGGRFIAGLYVGLLNRDAEFSGWQFQRNALSTGLVNPSQLVSNFLGAAEYKLTYGEPDDAGYVRLLYRYVLLREASQREIDVQTGALRSGVTRVQLAANFLNSSEFRTGTGPRLTAFVLYACTLLRDPGVVERDRIIGDLAGSVPVRTIIAALLATSEFAALLQ